MRLHYNKTKLTNTLLDFYHATGVNVSIVDADCNTIAEIHHGHNVYCAHIKQYTTEKCKLSDKVLFQKCKLSRSAEMHICHAGLLDIALPVIFNETIIAYVIMGQMKVAPDFRTLESYIETLGLNPSETQQIYENLPYFDATKIQAIANLAVMLTKFILLEHMLTTKTTESLGKAEQFISENLQKELTVRDIERGTNLSKSVLYKDFHACFNCTLKEYINSKRIEKAVELITSTDLSMDEISQRVGFSSAAYFSKVFKSQKGVPPLKYKKLTTI